MTQSVLERSFTAPLRSQRLTSIASTAVNTKASIAVRLAFISPATAAGFSDLLCPPPWQRFLATTLAKVLVQSATCVHPDPPVIVAVAIASSMASPASLCALLYRQQQLWLLVKEYARKLPSVAFNRDNSDEKLELHTLTNNVELFLSSSIDGCIELRAKRQFAQGYTCSLFTCAVSRDGSLLNIVAANPFLFCSRIHLSTH